MKKISRSFLFLLILTSFFSCTDDHLREDMIQFDRAFIPVFYYTSLGNVEAAEAAMYPLRAKWQHYQSSYHRQEREWSEDWKENIRMVGAWLEDANCALQEKDAYRALVQLDHARYELVDLRSRAHVQNYYLDYLWDMEASMYYAIETATDPMIDLMEFNEFKMMSEEVSKAWVLVQQKSIDEGLFPDIAGQNLLLDERKSKLGMAVNDLLQSVKTADRCQFAEAAQAIEPAYLNYLALFGDFESAKTHYALKK
jgi:hypothetical protein